MDPNSQHWDSQKQNVIILANVCLDIAFSQVLYEQQNSHFFFHFFEVNFNE